MPLPPPLGGGIKRLCSLTSVYRVHRPKSRTLRPRKTKIGSEVVHVTRDSDTIFKVRRSKCKVTGAYCGGLPHSFRCCLLVGVLSLAVNKGVMTNEL